MGSIDKFTCVRVLGEAGDFVMVINVDNLGNFLGYVFFL